MSLDKATVAKIARLARLRVADTALEPMAGELNKIIAFVEQLKEVDTTDVPPMTSAVAMRLRLRPDVVTDGGKPQDILSNAPETVDGFFVVPKVIE